MNEGYRAWAALESVLNNKGLGINAKKYLYEGVIVPAALHGAEVWVVMQKKHFFAPFFFYLFFYFYLFLICQLIKYFIKMYSIDMNHMCISLGNG